MTPTILQGLITLTLLTLVWRQAKQIKNLRSDIEAETNNRRDRDKDLYGIVAVLRRKLGIPEPPDMHARQADWDQWRKTAGIDEK